MEFKHGVLQHSIRTSSAVVNDLNVREHTIYPDTFVVENDGGRVVHIPLDNVEEVIVALQFLLAQKRKDKPDA